MTALPRGALLAVLALAGMAAAQDGQQVQNPFRPFDRAQFEAHVKQVGATETQLQQFAQQVEDLGAARAADALLRAMFTDFDAAVGKAENGDPTAALALAQVLTKRDDAVLGAHARYHLARVFLDGDDPERAVEVLNEYLQHNINRSALDGEAAFFYAQALAEIPMPEHALPRFKAFLAWFPEAGERFRSVAQQRIGEIERQQDSRLHTLADGMKKVGRDLRKQKTDKPVQVEQEEFIEELNELIEMYEQMERQSSGSPSGNQQSNGPADNSALVEGEARIGSLEKRASVADRWGEMRDKDRKEVESAVQNTLTPHYRKMLEEYFKKLGTGTGDRN